MVVCSLLSSLYLANRSRLLFQRDEGPPAEIGGWGREVRCAFALSGECALSHDECDDEPVESAGDGGDAQAGFAAVDRY